MEQEQSHSTKLSPSEKRERQTEQTTSESVAKALSSWKQHSFLTPGEDQHSQGFLQHFIFKWPHASVITPGNNCNLYLLCNCRELSKPQILRKEKKKKLQVTGPGYSTTVSQWVEQPGQLQPPTLTTGLLTLSSFCFPQVMFWYSFFKDISPL